MGERGRVSHDSAGPLTSMLLFELFPAFVMILSAVVGGILFVRDRRARRDGDE